MNRDYIINLILENVEDDIVPITEDKEEQLITLLYDKLENCRDDSDFEDKIENNVYEIKRFIKKHISDNLSPDIFKKCLKVAIKDFKSDSSNFTRSAKERLNKFVKFIKTYIED